MLVRMELERNIEILAVAKKVRVKKKF